MSADDLIENFELDTTDHKTVIQREETKEWVQPENLGEINSFGNNISYGNFTTEGNPPFSIIIKELKYYEDITSISQVLQELKIIKDENIDEIKTNLERGQLLIPRLSEYAAIILCHKLRSFDVEILMGLTEEISPPKSYQSNDRGLTNKATILSNKTFHKTNAENLTKINILTSTLPTMEGYRIKQHLGVISHSENISSLKLRESEIEDEILSRVETEEKNKIEELRLRRENQLASKSFYHDVDEIYKNDPRFKSNNELDKVYQGLVEKIKQKALTNEANGVLGINFSVTPVALEQYLETGPQYQVLCTGNMVWLEKN